MRALLLVLLVAPLLPPAPAMAVPRVSEGVAGERLGSDEIEALLGPDDTAERRARDARLSFPPGAAARAAADLRSGRLAGSDRAAALVAVGAGGGLSDLALLAKAARGGDPDDRRAAALALGELGPAAEPALLDLLCAAEEEAEPEAAEEVLLALVRAGGPRGPGRVRALEEGETSLAAAAASALAFAQGGAETEAGERLLELRWRAARRYGLVDGVTFDSRVLGALSASEPFLDRVVFEAAAAALHSGPTRDHLVQVVLGGGTPERLRGAARAMPAELAELIAAGLWRPASAAEWEAILDVLEEHQGLSGSEALLARAVEVPGLAERAAVVLVAGGAAEAWPLAAPAASAPEPARRRAVAAALGGIDDPARLKDLNRLRRDADPSVRAAALVSLVRVGHEPAEDVLADVVADAEATGFEEVVLALARGVPRDRSVATLLERALANPGIDPGLALRATAALARRGRPTARSVVRGALEDAPAESEGLLPELVGALTARADPRDAATLRRLFPLDADPETNARLAVALVLARDRAAVPLLRAALWRGPWNRSVLAGGLLVHMGGTQLLLDELRSPPAGARSADLRRVGFAVGEWGGAGAVEVLARRLREGDPALQGAFLGALAARTR